MEKQGGIWRNNGLSIALALMFLASLVGQALAGHATENEALREHGEPPRTLAEYLTSGEFVSVTFENWESEFLQMAVYVLLTVWLFQKGSAESRPLDPKQEEEVEKAGRKFWRGPTPASAKAPGLRGVLYRNSLSIALFSLFLLSFVAHWLGSWRKAVEEQLLHGEPAPTLFDHFVAAQFWFESFQNWQSEFLAVLALVVLSIFLRQEHSPQSKPCDAPHDATGS